MMQSFELKVPVDQTEIILTIKSMHSEKIYLGCKKFELRKSLPRSIPRKIYLYETEDTKAITGHVIIDKVLTGDPKKVWREIADKGIEKDRYNAYFDGQSVACVYSILHAVKYKNPIGIDILKKEFSFNIPQHFTYTESFPELSSYLNDYSLNQVLIKEDLDGLRLDLLSETNESDFSDLVDKSISKNYADTGKYYPLKLLDQYKNKKASGSLTLRRKYIFEIVKSNNLYGYIVITQKITGAYKTAPFCLHDKYTGQGIGPKIRRLIHSIVQKHGGRKVYCTAPTANQTALNYLLSSNYQIEAHLMHHYHKDHSDLVYGYDLTLATDIKKLEVRPMVRSNTSKANMVHSWSTDVENNIKLCLRTLMSDHMANNYFQKLKVRISSKDFLVLAYENPVDIAIIIERKTNSTVRLHIFATHLDVGLLKKLITSAELEANIRLGAKKIFTTIDILDFQLLPIVLEMGYRPEGVLKGLYHSGSNMMLVSKNP